MSFLVHINYQMPRRGLPAAVRLRAWVEAALRGARRRRGEVSLLLVEADQGRQMNLQYRQRDYPTNVLSFPVERMPGVKSDLLGDLVICAPVVAVEASAQGKTLADHYAHLCIHGCLHLLGYDHQNPAEAERMEALETRILARLGIADPYQDAAES